MSRSTANLSRANFASRKAADPLKDGQKNKTNRNNNIRYFQNVDFCFKKMTKPKRKIYVFEIKSMNLDNNKMND